MRRSLLCFALVTLAGCQICETPTFKRPVATGEVWDTTWLIDADPSGVTITDLEDRSLRLDAHYWTYAQVNGVLWPPHRTEAGLDNPDRWVNGGDSGIYTGTALAAFAFRYKAERSNIALARVRDTLRGVYILTHASGTPGVIQRNSFPSNQAGKFGYPGGPWVRRTERGFVHSGPILDDPFGGPQIPSQTYYTRATKDQLTGIVLGLSAVWAVIGMDEVPLDHLEEAIAISRVVALTTRDIYKHLTRYDWKIRDEHGKNDTNSDYVNNLLRTSLLALVAKTGVAPVQREYDEEFDEFINYSNTLAYVDQFANFNQYYAHNLRASRALSIWLLEGPESDKGKKMAQYIEDNLWKFVEGQKNAWFCFTRAVTTEDADAVKEGVYSLKSLSLKPIRMWSSPYFGQEQRPNILASLVCARNYVVDPHLRKPTRYTTWQKEPWDTGGGDDWDKEGLGDTTGLDFLLAYWLGKAYDLF